jgi:predicted phosphoribosyltransferase
MSYRFANRMDAGRVLAGQLRHLSGQPNLLVLALPRGGVPVAFQIAFELHAPLEIFLVRKLGVPWHEEFAMGAIASGGSYFLNDEVVQKLGIPQREIDGVIEREKAELLRRELAYGQSLAKTQIENHTVILVDDGLATGSTMRAAIIALRQQQPARIIVAVPVAAAATVREMAREVDEIVCAYTPEPFLAVGEWYEDFSQTTDEEVRELLERAGSLHAA